jgi:hypothetical protein
MAVPFITFKLKKANAPSRFAHFDELPSWDDLSSRIARLFNIPSNRVGVAFIAKEKELENLSDKRDLQRFYESLDQRSDQRSEEIKFVV